MSKLLIPSRLPDHDRRDHIREEYEILIANLVTFHAANYKRAFYKDIVMDPSTPGLQNRYKSGIRVSKRQLDFMDKTLTRLKMTCELKS